MSVSKKDIKDISELIRKKLELYMNVERRETRFDPRGRYTTTPKMHKYDFLYKVLDSSVLDSKSRSPRQDKHGQTRPKSSKQSPDRSKSAKRAPERPKSSLVRSSHSPRRDRRQRRVISPGGEKRRKLEDSRSKSGSRKKDGPGDRAGKSYPRPDTTMDESSVVSDSVQTNASSSVQSRVSSNGIKPRLDDSPSRVVLHREKDRLSTYATKIFSEVPVDEIQLIHRYRPYYEDNGEPKYQGYSRHVGSILKSKNFVQFYNNEALQHSLEKENTESREKLPPAKKSSKHTPRALRNTHGTRGQDDVIRTAKSSRHTVFSSLLDTAGSGTRLVKTTSKEFATSSIESLTPTYTSSFHNIDTSAFPHSHDPYRPSEQDRPPSPGEKFRHGRSVSIASIKSTVTVNFNENKLEEKDRSVSFPIIKQVEDKPVVEENEQALKKEKKSRRTKEYTEYYEDPNTKVKVDREKSNVEITKHETIEKDKQRYNIKQIVVVSVDEKDETKKDQNEQLESSGHIDKDYSESMDETMSVEQNDFYDRTLSPISDNELSETVEIEEKREMVLIAEETEVKTKEEKNVTIGDVQIMNAKRHGCLKPLRHSPSPELTKDRKRKRKGERVSTKKVDDKQKDDAIQETKVVQNVENNNKESETVNESIVKVESQTKQENLTTDKTETNAQGDSTKAKQLDVSKDEYEDDFEDDETSEQEITPRVDDKAHEEKGTKTTNITETVQAEEKTTADEQIVETKAETYAESTEEQLSPKESEKHDSNIIEEHVENNQVITKVVEQKEDTDVTQKPDNDSGNITRENIITTEFTIDSKIDVSSNNLKTDKSGDRLADQIKQNDVDDGAEKQSVNQDEASSGEKASRNLSDSEKFEIEKETTVITEVTKEVEKENVNISQRSSPDLKSNGQGLHISNSTINTLIISGAEFDPNIINSTKQSTQNEADVETVINNKENSNEIIITTQDDESKNDIDDQIKIESKEYCSLQTQTISSQATQTSASVQIQTISDMQTQTIESTSTQTVVTTESQTDRQRRMSLTSVDSFQVAEFAQQNTCEIEMVDIATSPIPGTFFIVAQKTSSTHDIESIDAINEKNTEQIKVCEEKSRDEKEEIINESNKEIKDILPVDESASLSENIDQIEVENQDKDRAKIENKGEEQKENELNQDLNIIQQDKHDIHLTQKENDKELQEDIEIALNQEDKAQLPNEDREEKVTVTEEIIEKEKEATSKDSEVIPSFGTDATGEPENETMIDVKTNEELIQDQAETIADQKTKEDIDLSKKSQDQQEMNSSDTSIAKQETEVCEDVMEAGEKVQISSIPQKTENETVHEVRSTQIVDTKEDDNEQIEHALKEELTVVSHENENTEQTIKSDGENENVKEKELTTDHTIVFDNKTKMEINSENKHVSDEKESVTDESKSEENESAQQQEPDLSNESQGEINEKLNEDKDQHDQTKMQESEQTGDEMTDQIENKDASLSHALDTDCKVQSTDESVNIEMKLENDASVEKSKELVKGDIDIPQPSDEENLKQTIKDHDELHDKQITQETETFKQMDDAQPSKKESVEKTIIVDENVRNENECDIPSQEIEEIPTSQADDHQKQSMVENEEATQKDNVIVTVNEIATLEGISKKERIAAQHQYTEVQDQVSCENAVTVEKLDEESQGKVDLSKSDEDALSKPSEAESQTINEEKANDNMRDVTEISTMQDCKMEETNDKQDQIVQDETAAPSKEVTEAKQDQIVQDETTAASKEVTEVKQDQIVQYETAVASKEVTEVKQDQIVQDETAVATKEVTEVKQDQIVQYETAVASKEVTEVKQDQIVQDETTVATKEVTEDKQDQIVQDETTFASKEETDVKQDQIVQDETAAPSNKVIEEVKQDQIVQDETAATSKKVIEVKQDQMVQNETAVASKEVTEVKQDQIVQDETAVATKEVTEVKQDQIVQDETAVASKEVTEVKQDQIVLDETAVASKQVTEVKQDQIVQDETASAPKQVTEVKQDQIVQEETTVATKEVTEVKQDQIVQDETTVATKEETEVKPDQIVQDETAVATKEVTEVKQDQIVQDETTVATKEVTEVKQDQIVQDETTVATKEVTEDTQDQIVQDETTFATKEVTEVKQHQIVQDENTVATKEVTEDKQDQIVQDETAVASKEVTEVKQDQIVQDETTVATKEVTEVKQDQIVQDETTVASKEVTEVKQDQIVQDETTAASKDGIEDKQDQIVQDETTVASKEVTEVKQDQIVQDETTVASKEVTEVKQDQIVHDDTAVASKEVAEVKQDQIVHDETAVASKEVVEVKQDQIVQDDTAVASKEVVEVKQDQIVQDETAVASKEVVEVKQDQIVHDETAVASKEVTEEKQDQIVQDETAVASKEVTEVKQDQIVQDETAVASKEVTEDKQDQIVQDETAFASKEETEVKQDQIVQDETTVVTKEVTEVKQDQIVQDETAVASKEETEVKQDQIVQDETTAASKEVTEVKPDQIVQDESTVASKQVTEVKQDQIVQDETTVATKEVTEVKQDQIVQDETAVASKEETEVKQDQIVQDDTTVASKEVTEDKQDQIVQDETTVASKEVTEVKQDQIVQDETTAASKEVTEDKQNQIVQDEPTVASKEVTEVKQDQIVQDETNVASKEVTEVKQDQIVQDETAVASKEETKVKQDQIVQDDTTAASKEVIEDKQDQIVQDETTVASKEVTEVKQDQIVQDETTVASKEVTEVKQDQIVQDETTVATKEVTEVKQDQIVQDETTVASKEVTEVKQDQIVQDETAAAPKQEVSGKDQTPQKVDKIENEVDHQQRTDSHVITNEKITHIDSTNETDKVKLVEQVNETIQTNVDGDSVPEEQVPKDEELVENKVTKLHEDKDTNQHVQESTKLAQDIVISEDVQQAEKSDNQENKEKQIEEVISVHQEEKLNDFTKDENEIIVDKREIEEKQPNGEDDENLELQQGTDPTDDKNNERLTKSHAAQEESDMESKAPPEEKAEVGQRQTIDDSVEENKGESINKDDSLQQSKEKEEQALENEGKVEVVREHTDDTKKTTSTQNEQPGLSCIEMDKQKETIQSGEAVQNISDQKPEGVTAQKVVDSLSQSNESQQIYDKEKGGLTPTETEIHDEEEIKPDDSTKADSQAIPSEQINSQQSSDKEFEKERMGSEAQEHPDLNNDDREMKLSSSVHSTQLSNEDNEKQNIVDVQKAETQNNDVVLLQSANKGDVQPEETEVKLEKEHVDEQNKETFDSITISDDTIETADIQGYVQTVIKKSVEEAQTQLGDTEQVKSVNNETQPSGINQFDIHKEETVVDKIFKDIEQEKEDGKDKSPQSDIVELPVEKDISSKPAEVEMGASDTMTYYSPACEPIESLPAIIPTYLDVEPVDIEQSMRLKMTETQALIGDDGLKQDDIEVQSPKKERGDGETSSCNEIDSQQTEKEPKDAKVVESEYTAHIKDNENNLSDGNKLNEPVIEIKYDQTEDIEHNELQNKEATDGTKLLIPKIQTSETVSFEELKDGNVKKVIEIDKDSVKLREDKQIVKDVKSEPVIATADKSTNDTDKLVVTVSVTVERGTDRKTEKDIENDRESSTFSTEDNKRDMVIADLKESEGKISEESNKVGTENLVLNKHDGEANIDLSNDTKLNDNDKPDITINIDKTELDSNQVFSETLDNKIYTQSSEAKQQEICDSNSSCESKETETNFSYSTNTFESTTDKSSYDGSSTLRSTDEAKDSEAKSVIDQDSTDLKKELETEVMVHTLNEPSTTEQVEACAIKDETTEKEEHAQDSPEMSETKLPVNEEEKTNDTDKSSMENDLITVTTESTLTEVSHLSESAESKQPHGHDLTEIEPKEEIGGQFIDTMDQIEDQTTTQKGEELSEENIIDEKDKVSEEKSGHSDLSPKKTDFDTLTDLKNIDATSENQDTSHGISDISDASEPIATKQDSELFEKHDNNEGNEDHAEVQNTVNKDIANEIVTLVEDTSRVDDSEENETEKMDTTDDQQSSNVEAEIVDKEDKLEIETSVEKEIDSKTEVNKDMKTDYLENSVNNNNEIPDEIKDFVEIMDDKIMQEQQKPNVTTQDAENAVTEDCVTATSSNEQISETVDSSKDQLKIKDNTDTLEEPKENIILPTEESMKTDSNILVDRNQKKGDTEKEIIDATESKGDETRSLESQKIVHEVEHKQSQIAEQDDNVSEESHESEKLKEPVIEESKAKDIHTDKVESGEKLSIESGENIEIVEIEGNTEEDKVQIPTDLNEELQINDVISTKTDINAALERDIGKDPETINANTKEVSVDDEERISSEKVSEEDNLTEKNKDVSTEMNKDVNKLTQDTKTELSGQTTIPKDVSNKMETFVASESNAYSQRSESETADENKVEIADKRVEKLTTDNQNKSKDSETEDADQTERMDDKNEEVISGEISDLIDSKRSDDETVRTEKADSKMANEHFVEEVKPSKKESDKEDIQSNKEQISESAKSGKNDEHNTQEFIELDKTEAGVKEKTSKSINIEEEEMKDKTVSTDEPSVVDSENLLVDEIQGDDHKTVETSGQSEDSTECIVETQEIQEGSEKETKLTDEVKSNDINSVTITQTQDSVALKSKIDSHEITDELESAKEENRYLTGVVEKVPVDDIIQQDLNGKEDDTADKTKETTDTKDVTCEQTSEAKPEENKIDTQEKSEFETHKEMKAEKEDANEETTDTNTCSINEESPSNESKIDQKNGHIDVEEVKEEKSITDVDENKIESSTNQTSESLDSTTNQEITKSAEQKESNNEPNEDGLREGNDMEIEAKLRNVDEITKQYDTELSESTEEAQSLDTDAVKENLVEKDKTIGNETNGDATCTGTGNLLTESVHKIDGVEKGIEKKQILVVDEDESTTESSSTESSTSTEIEETKERQEDTEYNDDSGENMVQNADHLNKENEETTDDDSKTEYSSELSAGLSHLSTIEETKEGEQQTDSKCDSDENAVQHVEDLKKESVDKQTTDEDSSTAESSSETTTESSASTTTEETKKLGERTEIDSKEEVVLNVDVKEEIKPSEDNNIKPLDSEQKFESVEANNQVDTENNTCEIKAEEADTELPVSTAEKPNIDNSNLITDSVQNVIDVGQEEEAQTMDSEERTTESSSTETTETSDSSTTEEIAVCEEQNKSENELNEGAKKADDTLEKDMNQNNISDRKPCTKVPETTEENVSTDSTELPAGHTLELVDVGQKETEPHTESGIPEQKDQMELETEINEDVTKDNDNLNEELRITTDVQDSDKFSQVNGESSDLTESDQRQAGTHTSVDDDDQCKDPTSSKTDNSDENAAEEVKQVKDERRVITENDKQGSDSETKATDSISETLASNDNETGDDSVSENAEVQIKDTAEETVITENLAEDDTLEKEINVHKPDDADDDKKTLANEGDKTAEHSTEQHAESTIVTKAAKDQNENTSNQLEQNSNEDEDPIESVTKSCDVNDDSMENKILSDSSPMEGKSKEVLKKEDASEKEEQQTSEEKDIVTEAIANEHALPIGSDQNQISSQGDIREQRSEDTKEETTGKTNEEASTEKSTMEENVSVNDEASNVESKQEPINQSDNVGEEKQTTEATEKYEETHEESTSVSKINEQASTEIEGMDETTLEVDKSSEDKQKEVTIHQDDHVKEDKENAEADDEEESASKANGTSSIETDNLKDATSEDTVVPEDKSKEDTTIKVDTVTDEEQSREAEDKEDSAEREIEESTTETVTLEETASLDEASKDKAKEDLIQQDFNEKEENHITEESEIPQQIKEGNANKENEKVTTINMENNITGEDIAHTNKAEMDTINQDGVVKEEKHTLEESKIPQEESASKSHNETDIETGNVENITTESQQTEEKSATKANEKTNIETDNVDTHLNGADTAPKDKANEDKIQQDDCVKEEKRTSEEAEIPEQTKDESASRAHEIDIIKAGNMETNVTGDDKSSDEKEKEDKIHQEVNVKEDKQTTEESEIHQHTNEEKSENMEKNVIGEDITPEIRAKEDIIQQHDNMKEEKHTTNETEIPRQTTEDNESKANENAIIKTDSVEKDQTKEDKASEDKAKEGTTHQDVNVKDEKQTTNETEIPQQTNEETASKANENASIETVNVQKNITEEVTASEHKRKEGTNHQDDVREEKQTSEDTETPDISNEKDTGNANENARIETSNVEKNVNGADKASEDKAKEDTIHLDDKMTEEKQTSETDDNTTDSTSGQSTESTDSNTTDEPKGNTMVVADHTLTQITSESDSTPRSTSEDTSYTDTFETLSDGQTTFDSRNMTSQTSAKTGSQQPKEANAVDHRRSSLSDLEELPLE